VLAITPRRYRGLIKQGTFRLHSRADRAQAFHSEDTMRSLRVPAIASTSDCYRQWCLAEPVPVSECPSLRRRK